MKSHISIEALEALDAIDCKGSFAAAAAHLYKVPSAITYTVQKLEQDLDIQVFTRQGRRSELTPAGRILLEQGRDILEATQRLAELAKQTDSGWESTLSIAIDAILGVDHIYPLIQEFLEINPNIEIELFEETVGGGWEALIEKRCQLAIGLPQAPQGLSDIQIEHYKDISWAFAVNADHPLAKTTQTLKQSDIECYRAVVVRDSSINQPRMNHRLFSKQASLKVPSLVAKLEAQKQGLGIGFLPLHLAKPDLASGKLVALEIEAMEKESALYIAWQRGKKGKALQWFIERLKEQAS